jgi:hypothetical protein
MNQSIGRISMSVRAISGGERRTARRRTGLRLVAACLFAAAIGAGGAVAAAAPDAPAGNGVTVTKTAPAPPAALDNSVTGLPGHQVVNNSTNCNAGAFCFISVACPTGKLVTGGGASNSSFGTVFMSDSRPNGNNGWLAFVKNNGSAASTVFVWAVCVTP